jgi:long-chain fatty acid transport protein
VLIARRVARVIVVVLCGAAGTARHADAQTTAQFPVQFDFLTPGARSMALGGAYIGTADDATAAFTNPGGLAFFGMRQISGELRIRRLDTPFLSAGRISGTVTGIGEDTIAGPVYGHDIDTSVNPSFLAVVFPIPARRLSIAAYRHVLADIENNFFSRGPFERVTFFGQTDDRAREVPIGGTREVQITNYGGSVAYEWGSFGLGGGIALSVFRLASEFHRFGFESTIYGAPDRGIIGSTSTEDGDDVAITGNVGALWRAHPHLTIGATFRRGPAFDFTRRDRLTGDTFDVSRDGRFKVPDVFGVGINWSGLPHTRVVFDYDRVQYSQLKHDFVDYQTVVSAQTGSVDRAPSLVIDDANEWHGGVEYRHRWFDRDMAIRGGGWWDPDHTVRYEPTGADTEVDTLFEATLPGGKSVMHYTFGAALSFSGNVLDAAADLSSRTNSVTVSFLFRF